MASYGPLRSGGQALGKTILAVLRKSRLKRSNCRKSLFDGDSLEHLIDKKLRSIRDSSSRVLGAVTGLELPLRFGELGVDPLAFRVATTGFTGRKQRR